MTTEEVAIDLRKPPHLSRHSRNLPECYPGYILSGSIIKIEEPTVGAEIHLTFVNGYRRTGTDGKIVVGECLHRCGEHYLRHSYVKSCPQIARRVKAQRQDSIIGESG